MKILHHKNFIKDFDKLRKKEKERVTEAIKMFHKNSSDKRLNNHQLKGKYRGKRSINAGGDLRIIFQESGEYIEILLLRLGSHAKLYK